MYSIGCITSRSLRIRLDIFNLIYIVKAAKENCDLVFVSLFVNPSQFGINEDLDKYPRTEDSDLNLLSKEFPDIVFIPSASQIYPFGITLNVDQQNGTFVSVLGLSHQL